MDTSQTLSKGKQVHPVAPAEKADRVVKGYAINADSSINNSRTPANVSNKRGSTKPGTGEPAKKDMLSVNYYNGVDPSIDHLTSKVENVIFLRRKQEVYQAVDSVNNTTASVGNPRTISAPGNRRNDDAPRIGTGVEGVSLNIKVVNKDISPPIEPPGTVPYLLPPGRIRKITDTVVSIKEVTAKVFWINTPTIINRTAVDNGVVSVGKLDRNVSLNIKNPKIKKVASSSVVGISPTEGSQET